MTNLYYVDKPQLDMIDEPICLLDALRLNTLYMIQQAGSGHPGGSLSSLTIMFGLFWSKMTPGDVFISSKGHDAPALYACLQALGKLPFDTIHTLRRPGCLPGHPTVDVPGILFNSGSLGMGISKANGLAAADRLNGIARKIYVLVGDGELQEGQTAEAIRELEDSVYIMVDWNNLQLSQETYLTHDPRIWPPRMILSDTKKGDGVSFMEGDNSYHAGALADHEYYAAVDEISARIPNVELTPTQKIPYPRPAPSHELMKAYPQILAEAGRNPKVVVMDADLAPDCGLLEFRSAFPLRFFQCGIAEQNMVSMATGLSEGGFIPIVHSFAAFLCRRANDQIYNACCEGRHIVFVGTMAGLLPTGPGTSHECINDVEIMQTMPGITILQPITAEELQQALAWAIHEATGPVYISIQCWDIEGMRL